MTQTKNIEELQLKNFVANAKKIRQSLKESGTVFQDGESLEEWSKNTKIDFRKQNGDVGKRNGFYRHERGPSPLKLGTLEYQFYVIDDRSPIGKKKKIFRTHVNQNYGGHKNCQYRFLKNLQLNEQHLNNRHKANNLDIHKWCYFNYINQQIANLNHQKK